MLHGGGHFVHSYIVKLSGCHKHKCSHITLVQQGLVFIADQGAVWLDNITLLDVLLSTQTEELQMGGGRVMLVG